MSLATQNCQFLPELQRLGDAADVVVVSVNYRLGPLGFMCLESSVSYKQLCRETHLLAHLGWVDFESGCSTLCLVLPGLIGNWQNWLSSWA